MAIVKLYSRRLAESLQDEPDVYQYDQIPTPLRVQISMAIQDALGTERDDAQHTGVSDAYEFIHNTLRREYGVEYLPSSTKSLSSDNYGSVHRQIRNDPNILHVLDAIELCCAIIDSHVCRDYKYRRRNSDEICDESLEEINYRFKQHAVGYEFTNSKIIRIDSQILHEEAVKPALILLSDPEFAGAEEEYRKAFEQYRNGDNKAALTSCVASLESTIKSIIAIMNWPKPEKQTVKPLFDCMYDNGLIPPFWQNHFGGLRSMLEGGVPPVRNKHASHGQGQEVTEVPSYYVSFALHQTAACIVFLVKAMDDLRS